MRAGWGLPIILATRRRRQRHEQRLLGLVAAVTHLPMVAPSARSPTPYDGQKLRKPTWAPTLRPTAESAETLCGGESKSAQRWDLRRLSGVIEVGRRGRGGLRGGWTSADRSLAGQNRRWRWSGGGAGARRECYATVGAAHASSCFARAALVMQICITYCPILHHALSSSNFFCIHIIY